MTGIGLALAATSGTVRGPAGLGRLEGHHDRSSIQLVVGALRVAVLAASGR